MYNPVIHPDDADEMVSSVGPDQTLGAVQFGFALFAQTCQSTYLKLVVEYIIMCKTNSKFSAWARIHYKWL